MKVTAMKVERLKMSMKQSEIAKRIGCATSHISMIETLERYPGEEFRKGLEAVFGKPVKELLREI